MGVYLLRRTLQAVAVLFIVTMIVFALLHALPGGPARAILGPRATPAAFRLAFLRLQHRTALGGRAAFARGRRTDAARAARARPAAFPILIGPLVAVAIELRRWQVVFQKKAKANRTLAKNTIFFIIAFPD